MTKHNSFKIDANKFSEFFSLVEPMYASANQHYNIFEVYINVL